jgi:hypothetical protein
MKSFTQFLMLLLGAMFSLTFGVHAQVSSYAFSESIQPYVPITGGQVLSSLPSIPGTIDDILIPDVSIGFPFFYNGIQQSTLTIDANGSVCFGSTIGSYTPLSSVPNSISALGGDLLGRQFVTATRTAGSNTLTVVSGSTAGMQVGQPAWGTGIPVGATITAVSPTTITISANATNGNSPGFNFRAANGSIRYETIGSAPNRKFVVQWTNFSRYFTSAPSDGFSFQIILEESTNIIKTAYNVFHVQGLNQKYQVGLSGATNADFNNRTGDFNHSTAGTLNTDSLSVLTTDFPTIGRTFTWIPPSFPTLSFNSIIPSAVSCTTTEPRQIEMNGTIPTGSIVNMVLNYSFDGVPQTPINMTNTSGSIFTATIPAATPVNAVVSWDVLATSNFGTTDVYTGNSYQDQPLLGLTGVASVDEVSFCTGSNAQLTAAINTLPAVYAPGDVSYPSVDEDLGNVTITSGAAVVLSNTSAINSLSGTLGTATGVIGGYSDFSSLAIIAMTAGQTYNFSLSSVTLDSWDNSMAIFIDFNKDGDFLDAGEMVYQPTTTVNGAHTETGSFVIPATAFGNMRMRVVCNEALISSYPTSVFWGEFEDYSLAITQSVSWHSGTTFVGTDNPQTVSPTTTTSYAATIFGGGCSVETNSVDVVILALPTAPSATNSSQCGTIVPLAEVASSAGSNGSGSFFWYNLPNGGTLVQSPPLTPLPVTSCLYTFNLFDAFGDGWNGATLQVLDGTTVVATIGSLFIDGGSASETVSLQSGISYTLFWNSPGSFPEEVGITSVLDPSNNSIYSMAAVLGNPNINTILTTIVADCSAAPPTSFITEDGYTTLQTPLSATTTFYVSELGTNGCYSELTPVIVTVSNPDPIVFTSGDTPSICIGETFTTNGSSTNTSYNYTYVLSSYSGSGLSAAVTTANLSTTPTAAGVYNFTVTATDGICTAVQQMPLTVNALPIITSAAATPVTACHDAVVDLVASSTVSGPQTEPTGYCSTTNFGDAFMSEVSFGSIINNTSLMNPTALPYYTNYSISTNVNLGSTYPLSILNGSDESIISVWIDFNRDGFLDASEWQQVSTALAANTLGTINITIPSNASLGITKMRIRSRLSFNDNGSGDACVFMGSGETEDYLINIQYEPAVPYNYTWNSTPVINAASGTTVVSNNTSSQTTQSWTLTAIEAATGCVNSMTTAQVTIQPAFLAPLATNSAHCGVQIPTATVADQNSFVSPVYNWYATQTGGIAIQATTSASFTSTVSSTTTFYVSTTNPTTGCESERTPVTVTVSTPPTLTLSDAATVNCSGLATPIVSVTNGQSSFDTFTWSPSTAVAGTLVAGYSFNPTNLVANSSALPTTYTLTATQASGNQCVNTTTIVVSTNALPLMSSVTAGPNSTCAGTTVNLDAVSSTFANITANVGCNSASNSSISYPTPFGNFWHGAKQQFLFTAAELQAAGLVAGDISSLAFNVTTPVITSLTDYTISMKNSNVNALTTNFETALTTVFYSASFTPSALTGYANNTINFNVASFPWDGSSNVVVEICFNNDGFYTENASASYCTAFPGASHIYAEDASGVCSVLSDGYLLADRTDMIFSGTTGTNYTPSLSWSWPTLNLTDASTSTTAVNNGTTDIQATYTVQATNTLTGCSNTATTDPITIFALPQIGAGNDILMCTNNGSQNFTPTGTGAGVGGSYSWNNSAVNAQPFSVTQTTTFVVTGTDVNTCVNFDTMEVVFSTIPPVNGGTDQEICIGQTTSFTTTGLAPYTWDIASYAGSGMSNSVVNPTLVVTPTSAGVYTYSVSVANSVGCTNQDQVQLTVWALPTVSAGADQTICLSSPVILSGSGALTYTWTNGVLNANPFFPTSTATYSVDGVDINGCHNTDQVVVTMISQPVVNAGLDQTVCATTPVVLFAQPTVNTPVSVTGYQWSNNIANGSQFTPTTTATYTVTATGANGCLNQDQVVVTVLAQPNVIAGNDFTVCAGLSATLNATGAVSYSWNNGVTQATPFFPNATTTYTVTGTGANGCTKQDEVVVTVSTGPTVSVSPSQVVCANAPATLSAAATNSMGGFWSTTNGQGIISPNVSNGTVTYTPTTTDPVIVNLTYVASNACGNSSQSTTVTVLPIPTVNAGPDIASCSGLPVTLTATGNGFLTWNNNVTNNASFIPATSATYTVTAVGANNCVNSDQMVLTLLALPDVNAGANQTVCSGSTVTLNGSGANSYVWNNGVVNNVSFAPTTTQTYTVTGTALNGCQSSDQVLVTVNATPVALVSIVDDVTVSASPAGMNYQWINCASGTDIPTATSAQYTATANGSYAVIVTSLQGCEDVSDCITITSVGIDQVNITDMNVFPNPTNGEVNLSLPENVSVNVSIFDAQGKLVAEQMNVTNNGMLNIAHVTPGVYMVRLTADNAIQTFRVVKN